MTSSLPTCLPTSDISSLPARQPVISSLPARQPVISSLPACPPTSDIEPACQPVILSLPTNQCHIVPCLRKTKTRHFPLLNQVCVNFVIELTFLISKIILWIIVQNSNEFTCCNKTITSFIEAAPPHLPVCQPVIACLPACLPTSDIEPAYLPANQWHRACLPACQPVISSVPTCLPTSDIDPWLRKSITKTKTDTLSRDLSPC